MSNNRASIIELENEFSRACSAGLNVLRQRSRISEQVTELYAHHTPSGYRHFFAHPDIVRMNGNSFPIHRVRLTTDETGALWSWWNAEKREHQFTWGFREAVEMCFPYGYRAAEERGLGKLVRVRVERIEDLAAR
jgi:hypothetical protein